MRRSAPASASSAKSPVESRSKKILAETADPKQYLFKKMLMGDSATSEGSGKKFYVVKFFSSLQVP